MSNTTGIALAVGGITAANEAVFAPLAGHGTPFDNFNWRVVPATVGFAFALGGLEKVSPNFAKFLGYTALVTVLFIDTGKAGSVWNNLNKVMGYGKK